MRRFGILSTSVTEAFLVVIIVCVCRLNIVCGTQPGAKVRLTNAGFDYGVKIAVKELTNKVRGATLKPFHGSGDDLKYDLTNLQITDFGLTQKSFRPVSNAGISWKLGGVRLRLKGDFYYSYRKAFIHISDHGKFTVTASSISLDLLVKITADTKTLRPVLASDHCYCHIGHLKVNFPEGKWLYNLLAKLAEGKIRDIIQKAVCEQANKAVNEDGNHVLQKLKLTTPIAKVFELNYGFVQNPTFTSQYVETYHEGEVFWKGDARHAPVTPSPIPPLSNTTKMVYVWLSDYVANTFSYAAFTHNFLRYNLTADQLSKDSRHFLNTTCSQGSMTCIGNIIRQIGVKYPNCTVKIAINATEAPRAAATPSDLGVTGPGEATLYAVTRTGQIHFMLRLSMHLSMTAIGWVKKDIIYAQVNKLNLQFHVLKSDIGDVQDIILDTIAQFAISMYVKPKLNELGAKGFNLPVTGAMQFKDPQIKLIKGAIIIQSDVVYNGHQDEHKPKSPWMDADKSMDTDRSMEIIDGRKQYESRKL